MACPHPRCLNGGLVAVIPATCRCGSLRCVRAGAGEDRPAGHAKPAQCRGAHEGGWKGVAASCRRNATTARMQMRRKSSRTSRQSTRRIHLSRSRKRPQLRSGMDRCWSNTSTPWYSVLRRLGYQGCAPTRVKELGSCAIHTSDHQRRSARKARHSARYRHDSTSRNRAPVLSPMMYRLSRHQPTLLLDEIADPR